MSSLNAPETAGGDFAIVRSGDRMRRKETVEVRREGEGERGRTGGKIVV